MRVSQASSLSLLPFTSSSLSIRTIFKSPMNYQVFKIHSPGQDCPSELNFWLLSRDALDISASPSAFLTLGISIHKLVTSDSSAERGIMVIFNIPPLPTCLIGHICSVFSLSLPLVTASVQTIIISLQDHCNNLLMGFSTLVGSLFKSIPHGATGIMIFLTCRCYVTKALHKNEFHPRLPAHLQTLLHMNPISL